MNEKPENVEEKCTPKCAPDKHDRRRSGLILILVGIALLVLKNFEGPTDTVVFFLAGVAFLTGYIYKHAYGLLVPGCILLGLGVGSVGEHSSGFISDFSSVGLGVGFVAIFVIDYIYRRQSHGWPLIPGFILIAYGIAAGYPEFGDLLSKGWPLLLVLIGALIWLGLLGKSKEKNE